MLTVNSSNQYE